MTPADDRHLGERAELYALGALDDEDAERVNAHCDRCSACARLVGAAERAVATLLAATVPEHAPPPELARRIATLERDATPRRGTLARAQPYLRRSAIAAGMVLALGGGAGGVRAVANLREIASQDDAALATIADSHFKHANLEKFDPHAPVAKVLWSVADRWLYVIVGSRACACRVTIATDTGTRDLGIPLDHGATAALFATDLTAVRRVALTRDGRTLESTTLR